MGEGGAVFQEHMPEENVNANVEKKSDLDVKIEALTVKKGEEDNGLKEMELGNKCNLELETQNMDVDKECADVHKETDKTVEAEKVIKKGKEESIADKETPATGQDSENEETKTEEMEEDTVDKVEDEIDGVKEKGENTKHPNKGKGSKTRVRTKSIDGGKDKRNESDTTDKTKETTPSEIKTEGCKTSGAKKGKEPKTPAASTSERPVRERKSVERLVTTILKERDSAKDFHVEKGCGSALKDIPNVAYKLSRKKTDDTFKLLHTILFNRRAKAAEVKDNISRFSGFVWHDNEKKQKNKVKEKLDKCVKDKLLEFCDVLDIPVSKANTRKEDIIAKLIEFLVAPHATTSDLLAENKQSSRGKKRKRESKSTSGNSKASKGSTKGLKKKEGAPKKDGEAKSTVPEPENELGGKEEGCKEEDANDISERSGDEMSEQAESEEKEIGSEYQSDKNKGKQKHGLAKSSTKKGSAEKGTTKKKAILKTSSPNKAGGEESEQAENEAKEIETEEASGKNKGKRKWVSAKSSAEKGSVEKATTKKNPKTANPLPKKAATKSTLSHLKNTSDTDTGKGTSAKKKDESTTAKAASGKKKDESSTAKENFSKKKDESTTAKETSSKEEESTTAKKSTRKKKDESTTANKFSCEKKDEATNKSPAPRKSASKESTGAKVMKVKNKLKVEKSNPNDDELRRTIVKILKKVDFNTATFTDILKMMAKKYNTDFTPRKSAIKIMIQDELTKLADANEGDDKEDEGDTGKNDKQPSTQDVKA